MGVIIMFKQMRELFLPSSEKSEEVPQEPMSLEKQAQLEPLLVQNDSVEKAIELEKAFEYKQIFQQQKEIHELLKNTATLVDEQGEEIDSIRNNISDTLDNVQDGSLNTRIAEASRDSFCVIS